MNTITVSKKLQSILDYLNNYPIHQNERPLFSISKDRIVYYRRWYYNTSEKSVSIEDAEKCNNYIELQSLLGI